ncbi:AbrB/MazE/SpoVT family DNA-binding domain-containing protein [Candidatus Bathyarchaeota archaeon]|nr:AbrB/MazE/SpoVT family DNA-binding domain-containing protein [Candidatus Bathyarchaeota archaeon]
MTEAYVCKVTSVGQVTLPKEVREELGVGKDDYVIIEKIGETYFIKKLQGEKRLLARIRERVKKSGITREHLQEVVEEETQAAWEKTSKGLR